MPPLDGRRRAELPDRAFAYVDSKGKRRLPIHDEAHVRNALARFNRTVFESEAARSRARERVLRAARRYGIVPIGFVTGQIRSEAREADAGRLVIELGRIGAPGELEERIRAVLGDPTLSVAHWSEAAGTYLDRGGQPVSLPSNGDGRAVTVIERDGRPMTALVHDAALAKERDLIATVTAAVRLAVENDRLHGEVEAQARHTRMLPKGQVTFLLTDIEGSTGLIRRLADRYAAVLAEVRGIHRTAVAASGGHEVDARADEFFAAFDRPMAAAEAAVSIQRRLIERAWPGGVHVRVRMGLHTGRPSLTDSGYVGLAVHLAARVCAAGHGGQIVLSAAARDAIQGSLPAELQLRGLGSHALHGIAEPEALFQLDAPGLPNDFPALRARAWTAADDVLSAAETAPSR